MCLPEAAARQPLVHARKKLVDGQGDNHAHSHKSQRPAMDEEPPIDYPFLNGEAQGRKIPFADALAFFEPKADRLP